MFKCTEQRLWFETHRVIRHIVFWGENSTAFLNTSNKENVLNAEELGRREVLMKNRNETMNKKKN